MPTVSPTFDPKTPEGPDTYLQVISPDGTRHPCPELDEWVGDIDVPALEKLYIDMACIRRLDAEGTALQRQGELGLWAPLLGQEAAQIGSGRALENDDFIFPSYREHGVAYCRGVNPHDLLRMWRGAAPSGWNPYEVNMANQQIVIGAQTLHAAGYAMGLKFDGSAAAAITYFGDGATSQGDVSEAMVFAASYQAPLVFFCQNNHWAISEPVARQTTGHIADRAAGFGLATWRVDGNDVLAVMAATRAALAHVRTGSGPAFIEAVTYRMGAHTTADDPTRYRDALELEEWAAKDPLDRVAAHLDSLGADLGELKKRSESAADELAAGLREAITTMPDPTVDDLFAHVYSHPHQGLEEQRENYSNYLAGFAVQGQGTK
ncbi:pyruvate dehydrogenase (acetyl-transferring) E1 component subunit alpha [Paeniglutamicibacter sulfureus]|uniref:pyruvate dehydrogenase (acetyl-transferring) E1 component subunit alpha n=1 Tax=Paeniglutamicibacter sulfureus TaxID=43666 RepID=UPI002665FB2F|nr:pyruvate dehydrogenase (acetyl-transferring) E1 component subunit alpha [Paeniglutamicibacter sulfureus]MDO2933060.1 pyruvate dehydrogenase (acetyl-transferring) E1 component subunit alpha [Paeniglutamicibacter sulfureus]